MTYTQKSNTGIPVNVQTKISKRKVKTSKKNKFNTRTSTKEVRPGSPSSVDLIHPQHVKYTAYVQKQTGVHAKLLQKIQEGVIEKIDYERTVKLKIWKNKDTGYQKWF